MHTKQSDEFQCQNQDLLVMPDPLIYQADYL